MAAVSAPSVAAIVPDIDAAAEVIGLPIVMPRIGNARPKIAMLDFDNHIAVGVDCSAERHTNARKLAQLYFWLTS